MTERIVFKHPLFDFLFVREEFLQEGDPLKEYMSGVTATFDYLIDFLRQDFPNPHINEVCTLAWRLIGNKQVNVAMGLPIPTNFGFAILGSVSNPMPIVAIREDWLNYALQNRTMGLGAICLAASQCRDWYNGKIIGERDRANDRGNMYEAEMLLTLMQHEKFKPNDWQEQILKKFPKGLDSGKHLLYDRREYMGAS